MANVLCFFSLNVASVYVGLCMPVFIYLNFIARVHVLLLWLLWIFKKINGPIHLVIFNFQFLNFYLSKLSINVNMFVCLFKFLFFQNLMKKSYF